MSSDPSTYRELAERAWAWVLTQVRHGDEGMWLTEYPGQTEPGELRHALRSGRVGARVGGDQADSAPRDRRARVVLRRSARRWSAAFPTRRGTTTSTGSPAPSASSPPSTLRVSNWRSPASASSPRRTVGRPLDRASEAEPGWTLQRRDTGHRRRPPRRPLGSAARRTGRGGARRHTLSTSCWPRRSRGRRARTGRSSRCGSWSPARTCRCRTGRTARRASLPRWPPPG